MARTEARRIILVGKSGNGKSSTGNSILGEDKFKSANCFESVTQGCQPVSKFLSNVNREYTIMDTPGLFDMQVPFAKRALEIQQALETCPDPHAFLIVLRPDQRFTEEEQLTIDMLRIIFGQGFLNHAVLVFTRGSEYDSDQELNDVIARCKAINDLKLKCENRVVRVENNPRIDRTLRNDLLNKIFDCVEHVSDGGKIVYSNKSLDIHRKCLEEHLKNRKPEANLRDDLEHLVYDIGNKLEIARKEAVEEMKRAEIKAKKAEEAAKRAVQFKKEAEEAKKRAIKDEEDAKISKMRADALKKEAEELEIRAKQKTEEAKKEAAKVKKEVYEAMERAHKQEEAAKIVRKQAEEKTEEAAKANAAAVTLREDAEKAMKKAEQRDTGEVNFSNALMGLFSAVADVFVRVFKK